MNLSHTLRILSSSLTGTFPRTFVTSVNAYKRPDRLMLVSCIPQHLRPMKHYKISANMLERCGCKVSTLFRALVFAAAIPLVCNVPAPRFNLASWRASNKPNASNSSFLTILVYLSTYLVMLCFKATGVLHHI
jgi:hypothetical protein